MHWACSSTWVRGRCKAECPPHSGTAGRTSFSAVNVATNDHMACMHTVHPAAYVTFKRWLAGKPEREALKRRCDALQADAVQTLLDMALARAEGTAQRFYSLSAQVQRERKQ